MSKVGIASYGAYVPFNRLQRAAIGQALGVRTAPGSRAVASYDEDTVTMAVEAARGCLKRSDKNSVTSLYFATTEPPYQEKSNAATIHAALSLPARVRALEFGCSVRSGLGALIAAADSAAAGGSCLVAASDLRIGAPESSREQSGGDAAAAFLLSADNLIAEIVTSYSETKEYLSTWRLPGEKFPKSWEERFALTQAYGPLLENAARAVMSQAGVTPGDLAAVVIDTPNPRAVAGLAKALKLSEAQVVGDMATTVGHTGTAHAGLMLASALDRSSSGNLILVLSVSDGVDGLLLRALPAIETFEPASTVESLLESKRDDLSYTAYLKWRGILDTEPPRRPDPERPAAPPSLRSQTWKFGFEASKCTACGTFHLPPQVVCVKCGSTGSMTNEPFADRRAVVRTFTVDRLAYTPQPPMVVAMIDFEGGGRFQSELTDCEPDRVKIGDDVEMTFRRLFTAQGIHNYFWKARPAR